MPLTIIDRETAPAGLGAAFRRTRPGPERTLVETFLNEQPFFAPRGCSVTIFCEPRIESGFPDIVIVFWSTSVAEKWVPARIKLKTEDIRLVHYMHQVGSMSLTDLRKRSSRPISASLSRLEAAEMIYEAGGIWKARSIRKSFATRHILAVEAKISEWARALRQAFQNTWFASDSYVLLPRQKSPSGLRDAARPFGVRLCQPGKQLTYNKSDSPGLLPRSYVSWLFNEWAWRFAQL